MKNQQQILTASGLFLNGLIKANATGRFSGLTYRQTIPNLVTQEHPWVSVLDPRNKRSIVQACDDCGIVKSENSITRNCRATPGTGMISASISGRLMMM